MLLQPVISYVTFDCVEVFGSDVFFLLFFFFYLLWSELQRLQRDKCHEMMLWKLRVEAESVCRERVAFLTLPSFWMILCLLSPHTRRRSFSTETPAYVHVWLPHRLQLATRPWLHLSRAGQFHVGVRTSVAKSDGHVWRRMRAGSEWRKVRAGSEWQNATVISPKQSTRR